MYYLKYSYSLLKVYFKYYIKYLYLVKYINTYIYIYISLKALESYIVHVFNIVILFKLYKYITQPPCPLISV